MDFNTALAELRKDATFESKHPRDAHGRFGHGTGGESTGGESTGGESTGGESTAGFKGIADLAVRLGSLTWDLGLMVGSARALRTAQGRMEIGKHLLVLGATLAALDVHLRNLPHEASAAWDEARAHLQRLRSWLLQLEQEVVA
jgi:hypothetical protein